jgi:hypothetical protein
VDYRLGFAISNTFLRVYLDDTIVDITHPFGETTNQWKFVAVSYQRHYLRETYVTVFIDQSMVYREKIFDWHSFNISSSNYSLVIGKDFPGVVRKARINARSYCPGHTSTILSVTD